MTFQTTLHVLSDLPTDARNGSAPEGCITIRFSEWEYLPWNNPDNIVSREVRDYVRKARSSVLVILFLIGGPANVINMAVFFQQGLKDRVNLLLFSLSLADNLSLITSMLHYFEDFYAQFTGDKQLGRLYITLVNERLVAFQGFSYVSFVLSAMIACERCCCVVWPLKYQTLLNTRTLALAITAVYGTALGLFYIASSRYYIACVYDPDTGVVSKMFSHSEFYLRHTALVNYIDNIVFGAGLPSVAIIVVVTTTVITTWKLRKAVAWRTGIGSSISAKEVALTKMLIGTSILFIVCVSPTSFRRVASLFLPELNTRRRYENLFLTCIGISQMFYYINFSFNIFIYYAMGSRYRHTFWALFSRKTKQNGNMT